MNQGALVAFAGVYSVFALSTFGHLLRSGRSGWRRRALQVVAALLWPLYWLTIHGVGEVYRLLVDKLLLSEQTFTLYFLGVVFFPAYYLYKSWDTCDGTGCVAVVAKSLAWALFWPAYVVASLL